MSTTTASQSNIETYDSDDEDLTDVLPSLSMEYPLDVIDESEQSSNTHDTIGNKSIDDDNQSVSDETIVDEEPDGPHVDLSDSCSLDIMEDYDPATCELEQEYIGALMSKCRSFIKLVNKSFMMMMCISNLK